MAFVFSSWYIVAALIVVAIATIITVCVIMDKKDEIIINNFVKEASAEPIPAEATVTSESSVEKKD